MLAEQLGAAIGVLIIGLVIAEVFRDLFHPAHGGALSDWIGRHLFRLFRHAGHLPLAGPLAVVTVIGTWIVLLVLGFALVYNTAYPESFRTSTGSVPPSFPHFSAAVYFSFETLITLGYGDIVPQSTMMRLIAVLEAMVGFGLLTASVSSLVLFYPALSRMRLLARTVGHLVRAEQQLGAATVCPCLAGTLANIARDVTNARVDLVHFPITFYFATADPQASVAYWLPHLTELTRQSLSPDLPTPVRLSASMLDDALRDLANLLSERFLHVNDTDHVAVFRALARTHAVDTPELSITSSRT